MIVEPLLRDAFQVCADSMLELQPTLSMHLFRLLKAAYFDVTLRMALCKTYCVSRNGVCLQIVRSTEQYQRLLEAVPSVFVGTPSALMDLVEFMAARMEESFQEKGMSCPPWRQVRLRDNIVGSQSSLHCKISVAN